MEIVVFKFKSRILPVLTFNHSDLNILSYKSPFDANSFFFWILDSEISAYLLPVEKELIWERYDFS